jgi:hypothetical protein
VIYKLTETVFVQDGPHFNWTDRTGWSVFDSFSSGRSAKIAHVVNFYRATGIGQRTQLLTARSMIQAAASASDVKLVAVVDKEEKDAIPQSFEAASLLQRTIVDLRKFASQRPFPLLFDILNSGAAAAESGSYLVFTNCDICLLPNFYTVVRSLLARDVDCLIINRRSVAPLESFGAAPELAALEVGFAHPGLDCFIFPAAWVRDFVPNLACVGIGYVMRSLLFNLVGKARRMLILRDAHLTYHYGDDRPWNTPEFEEYTRHNVSEAKAVVKALSANPIKRTALYEFCTAHGEVDTDGNEIFPLGPRASMVKMAKRLGRAVKRRVVGR